MQMLVKNYLNHLRNNLVQICSDKLKNHRYSFWVLFCAFGSAATQLNSILSSLFVLFLSFIHHPRNTWWSADHWKSHLRLYSISSPILIPPPWKCHSSLWRYYISIQNIVFYPPTKSILDSHWHCETYVYVFSYFHYSLIWEYDDSESPI